MSQLVLIIRNIMIIIGLIAGIFFPFNDSNAQRNFPINPSSGGNVSRQTTEWGSKRFPICPKVGGSHTPIPARRSSTPGEDPNDGINLPGTRPTPGIIGPMDEGDMGLEINKMRAKSCIHLSITLGEWKMPPRFGEDKNGNGIIDLPNTKEYVQNSELSSSQVLFKTTFTKGGPGFSPKPSLPRDQQPNFKTSWRIDSLTVPGRSFSGDGNEITRSLPEDTYEVIVKQRIKFPFKVFVLSPTSPNMTPVFTDEPLPEGEWVQELAVSSKKQVTVDDLLIVSIGDSLSSGEGNPEKRGARGRAEAEGCHNSKAVYWADDGQDPPDYVDMKTCWVQRERRGEGEEGEIGNPARVRANFVTPRTSSEIAKMHIKAHRSTVAWPAQVALDLEKESSKSSVTFVSLATTGASIRDGLLFPGSGSGQEDVVFASPVVVPSSSGPRLRGDYFKGQIAAVEALIGGRDIDLLLISIGGNDVGFSKLVVSLALNGHVFSPINKDDILAAFKSGNWERMKNDIKNLEGVLGWYTKSKVPDDNVTGLRKLPESFQKLGTAIRRKLKPKHVAIIGYPDFTKASHSRDSLPKTCNKIVADAGKLPVGAAWIDAEEAKWAVRNVLTPLNNIIQGAAILNSWVYVDGIAALFESHGYCGPEPYSADSYTKPAKLPPHLMNAVRWIRQEKEFLTIQGLFALKKTMGTLHPNEIGHRKIADRVLGKIGRLFHDDR